jgi:ketosteroid isomerase-like protein
MSAPYDQIRATLERFADAWQTNDGAAVASFFADDGSLVNPFGERADGEQTIHAPDGSLVLAVHIAALMRRSADRWRIADARPYVYATPPA